MWRCPICGETTAIGLAVGTPSCGKCGCDLVPFEESPVKVSSQAIVGGNISVGAKVNVGGDLTNYGKIKVFSNGELNVRKDLINSGDLTVNDPEKIKDILIEVVKTSGTLAELGANILRAFFRVG